MAESRDKGHWRSLLMTVAISALAFQDIEVEVGFVCCIAFRIQHCREEEAACGTDCALEGTDQSRILAARLHGDILPFFEAETCDVDRVAAGMLGHLAGLGTIAQATNVG